MGEGAVKADLFVVSKFKLDGGAMFGIVPRPLWEKEHPPDQRGGINLVARALVLRFESQGRIAVVDAGLGRNWSRREVSRYSIDLSVPDIAQALQPVGISRDDVTDAVITHLHFDHAGGWMEKTGSGELKPVFPNAAHHVQKEQWTWARNPSVKDRGSYFFENLRRLEADGLLNPLEGSGELFPGLRVVALGGHTPGLQIPVVEGQTKKMAFLSDLVPTLAHARLAWIMAFDLFPLSTLEEKRSILSQAAEEGWTVALEHDPNFEAATVRRQGAEFELSPCEFPDAL